MVMGESGGSRNSKVVGPTGEAPAEPMRGTERVRGLVLRCELMTYRAATDVPYTEVAANLIWWWDSSRGGRTPTARHVSLKHLRASSVSGLSRGRGVPLWPQGGFWVELGAPLRNRSGSPPAHQFW